MPAIAALEQGREFYARRPWAKAHESLAVADETDPLSAEDLELLARSAYMIGRDDAYASGLEQAHHAYLQSGEPLPAVCCAWWIGHSLMFRGEFGLLVVHVGAHPHAAGHHRELAEFTGLLLDEVKPRIGLITYERIVEILRHHDLTPLADDLTRRLGLATA